jgi:ABC-2 type transport system permease protein
VVAIVLLLALALTWLTVALGVAADSVETASNTPMFLLILPFLGSGFVPTESMPAGIRWFAEYQPFTPVMDTLRGLLAGTPSAHDAVLAVGWCILITVLSAIWGVRVYHRKVTG